MRIVSVFDGMACGMLAMQSAGVSVDRYVAFEIDKYAVQTSSYNFPMIEHRGDVFKADFTEFRGFDFLIGGSPCTYWSIAQKNNRETEASGMGWELFSQYVRALKEAQPMWFIYENNKSMSNAIRESITQTFGFEPICINSALVSAQNRQRLYWVGKRNLDGTYSRVKVDQPADRGILLRDVLDGLCWRDKAYTIDSNYHKTLGQQGFDRQSGRRKMVAEPCVSGFGETNGKSFALTASYYKGQPINKVIEKSQRTHVAEPVRIPGYGIEDKARPVTACYAYKGSGEGSLLSEAFPDNPNKQVRDYVAEPVACRCRGRVDKNGNGYAKYECREDGKANTLDTNTVNGSMVAEPCIYQVPHGFNDGGIKYEKSPTLTANGSWVENNKVIDVFAIAVEWDDEGKPTKAISGADGKTYPVFEVKDGQITIKGKQYPIKLADGFYIIRKLTVSECKRLQTVPEWYEFPVSDSQAYRQLGNGWTVLIISHLIQATQANELEEEQLDLFKMGVF